MKHISSQASYQNSQYCSQLNSILSVLIPFFDTFKAQVTNSINCFGIWKKEKVLLWELMFWGLLGWPWIQKHLHQPLQISRLCFFWFKKCYWKTAQWGEISAKSSPGSLQFLTADPAQRPIPAQGHGRPGGCGGSRQRDGATKGARTGISVPWSRCSVWEEPSGLAGSTARRVRVWLKTLTTEAEKAKY